MQSVPVYFPHNYSPTSPYPTTSSATTTTTTTSSPGTGSTVMTISNPPLLATPNGITPLEQNMLRSASNENNTSTNTVKRNQVKNACTNCQKACKKCDDARPCPRCIKYGISDTCINSVRKERKKGIKRGPYKRRQKSNDDTKSGTDSLEGQQYTIRSVVTTPTTTAASTATTTNATTAATAAIPAATDYGYPTNLTQYTQTYDPYHYAATATAVYNNSKEQTQGQGQQGVYIVNPAYSTYPLVNGNTTGNNNNNNTNGSNNDDAANNNYLSGILHQAAAAAAAAAAASSNNTSSSPSLNNPPPAPGVYYQQGSEQQTTTADGHAKQHQPMTPVPSTSNSSGTTSPSETAVGEDDEKFARLTQLCSAALRENKEAEAAAAAAAAVTSSSSTISTTDIKEEQK